MAQAHPAPLSLDARPRRAAPAPCARL